MKKITFSLARAQVFNEVALSSAYRSAKNLLEGQDPARCAMTEADRRLADSLFDLALGNLLNIVRPFVRDVANVDEALSISFEISADWPDHLRLQISKDLAAYFRHAILGEWLALLNDADANCQKQEAATRADAIVESLYLRPRPSRRS